MAPGLAYAVVMHYPTRTEIAELSPGERLQLIEDVWQTFEAAPDSLGLSKEHREVLDERMERLQKDPDRTMSWDEMRQKVRHKG